MTTDITELAQSEINDALAQLQQISEYPTPSTQYARVLRKYIASLVEALEKAQRNANLTEAERQAYLGLINKRDERIASLESRTVEVLTPEMRNALKAEGLADVLKDASEYAPLTAGQWETLTKNWHQTFIGLSGSAAGIKVEAE